MPFPLPQRMRGKQPVVVARFDHARCRRSGRPGRADAISGTPLWPLVNEKVESVEGRRDTASPKI